MASANFINHMEKYRAKLEEVPEEKVNQVSPQLGMPILDRLSYVTNEEIAELYIELLAKASSTETVNDAHPAFINIIERMSVDEARLIKYLEGKSVIPFLNIRIKGNNEFTYRKMPSYYTVMEKRVELLCPANINIYIGNLISLNIILPKETSLADKSHYESLKVDYASLLSAFNAELKKIEGRNETCDFIDSFFEVSELGKAFIKTINPNNLR